MDLSGVDITPTEGKVVLHFVDDEDADDQYEGTDDVEYEGCLAIVIGVGPGVKGVKKGDTVITTPYARDGLCVGDNTHICDAWCIAGTVK